MEGATNRPQDIDEAARRRFVKRIYIPLPNAEGRSLIIRNLLKKEKNVKIKEKEFSQIISLTEGNSLLNVNSQIGYSASDLTALCKDAAMEPVRELGMNIANVQTGTKYE